MKIFNILEMARGPAKREALLCWFSSGSKKSPRRIAVNPSGRTCQLDIDVRFLLRRGILTRVNSANSAHVVLA